MSRRNSARPDFAAEESSLGEAERFLRQAHEILYGGGKYQPEEWMLLATLVGEADLIVQAARRHNPALQFPLLKTVIEEFRAATSDFTNPEFVRSTRPARRRNRALFIPMA